MSEKNERLINLAIALIAARRPISKDQIFRSIEGYTGNQEAKDRMFERDKEALKSLGIDITIAPIDPLFDDEVGYRITENDYAISLGNLSPKEIGLLSVAAKLWESTTLAEPTKEILRRLHSLGVAANFEAVATKPNSLLLTDVLDAIYSDNCIAFEYLNEENIPQKRNFAPYSISSNQGLWYLHGLDLDTKAIRTFRLDRFAGEITKLTQKIDRPKEFKTPKFKEEVVLAKVRIRRDAAHLLRLSAKEIFEDGDWDIATIGFTSLDLALQEILWHGSDVVVLEPKGLRDAIIAALDKVIANHG